ncbi:MAG: potassium transporter TrkA, partial [Actinomycetota bacterium]
MYAIGTFTLVALFTLIITRLATGVLIATGLPVPIARFQARSAYSGTGFTTVEAENVVNHPVRRRVVYTLMIIGNLGTPTLVVTVVLGFAAPGPGDTLDRLFALLAGLAIILAVLSSGPVTRWVEQIGRRYANHRLLGALDH